MTRPPRLAGRVPFVPPADPAERADLEARAQDADWLRAFNAGLAALGIGPFTPWRGDCRLFSTGRCLVDWHDPCPFGVPKLRREGRRLYAVDALALLCVLSLAACAFLVSPWWAGACLLWGLFYVAWRATRCAS